MSETSEAAPAYGFPVGRAAKSEGARGPYWSVGRIFKEVRLIIQADDEQPKIETFAAKLILPNGKAMNAAHLGRIESGHRLPGEDAIAAIHSLVLQAQKNPVALIQAWLEAKGLGAYVVDLKRARRGST